MSSDVETLLRDTLASRADVLTSAVLDPWQRFATVELRHRRNRRLRTAAIAVVGVTVLGLAGFGVIPLPSWISSLTTEEASSPLLAEPTKGSLADDTEWLADFKEAVPALLDDTGPQADMYWNVEDPGKVHVVFAGDVFGHRRVIADVPLQTGGPLDTAIAWFRGPVGAAPSQLQQDGSGAPLVTPALSRLDMTDDGVAQALVIAPEGSRVEVSGEVAYRADGTVSRSWTELPVAPSGEIAGEFPARVEPLVALRIAFPGRGFETVLWDSVEDAGFESGTLHQLMEAAVANLDIEHRELALGYLFMELAQAGLGADATTVTTLWAGRIDGHNAILMAAQPRGGGVLLYAARSLPETGWWTDLRLLAPADGAYTRPYAWRLRNESYDNVAERVAVVAPPGADQVKLRLADGTSVPVELDRTGAGTAELADSQRATVVAYDAEGNVLGETPVPPLDDGSFTPVPGESAATSVVLASA